MPDAVLPLEDLTQRITQHESELERLRRAYETRQAQLARLTEKKESLASRLRQVEADIQAVTGGKSMPASAASPFPPSTPRNGRPKLADFILEMVRAAKAPISVVQLTEEVTRRRLPTASGNIRGMVSTRVHELVKKGLLQRAPDQHGVVLGIPGSGTPAPSGKKKAKRRGRRSGATSTTVAKVVRSKDQPSLRAVIADLLQKSKHPLAARELAAQALAGGYKTKSKNLVAVVWTALGQMDNVERVPEKGWRLK
jgi:hypothetical protein